MRARDTLHFEASMPLYGHELSEDITPIEAGLGFAVNMKKENFIGKEALCKANKRVRIGLEAIGRGIAREGYPVLSDGVEVGTVTSGMPAPSLGGNYAMALIDAAAAENDVFSIMVRGKEIPSLRRDMPFYRLS